MQSDVKFIEPLGAAASSRRGGRNTFYQFTAIEDCTRLRILRICPQLYQATADPVRGLRFAAAAAGVDDPDGLSKWVTPQWFSIRPAGDVRILGSGTRPSSLHDRLKRCATSCLLNTLTGGATAGDRPHC
ncbi:hypothetical protein ACQP2F_16225 [Actinoplanes sp. CA-030573]|uniref:hypothetical protein n=1 Tax=Actinoplanes sp. CA-030573 TaxID=3239898 RepID=UPI003D8D2BCC